jgi:hypothetical protein
MEALPRDTPVSPRPRHHTVCAAPGKLKSRLAKNAAKRPFFAAAIGAGSGAGRAHGPFLLVLRAGGISRGETPPVIVGFLARMDATMNQSTQGRGKQKVLVFQPGSVRACGKGGLVVLLCRREMHLRHADAGLRGQVSSQRLWPRSAAL